jgi:hypothetical protein
VAFNTAFGNTTDILWDGQGAGNRFFRNDCLTSDPDGLCDDPDEIGPGDHGDEGDDRGNGHQGDRGHGKRKHAKSKRHDSKHHKQGKQRHRGDD